jgi:N utilization substance protein B
VNKNHRTIAREYALKFMFQWEHNATRESKNKMKNPLDLAAEMQRFDVTYAETDTEHPENISTPAIKEYAMKLISGTYQEEEKLEKILEENLKNWSVKQLKKMDSIILKLALFEIKNLPETPSKVVVNEAINMAKAYSDENSSAFINSVLQKFI